MLQQLSDHIAYCHERARKCALQAETTADPRAKQAYLASERRWLMLATTYEVTGQRRSCTNGALWNIALPKPVAPPFGVPRVMCPDCGGRMHLRSVTPHPNRQGVETSTFECSCGHLYQQTVGRPRVGLGLVPAAALAVDSPRMTATRHADRRKCEGTPFPTSALLPAGTT